ncbi:putative phosphatidylethanolamine-binding protein [Rosellinia necatrix]|uniref:Large ribosomal subunit protein mL38 n=1 Tax=Rosellinia necatrix TaxID=77044 RepID=A0A1W2TSC6_ROSNE|nr:putative phosphatidylethanolamine-binding protein [Rosellinia necatrix]
MSTCQRVTRPLLQSIHHHGLAWQTSVPLARSFSNTSARRQDEVPPTTTSTPPEPKPTPEPKPAPAPAPTSTPKPATTSPSGGASAEPTTLRMQDRLMDPNTTTAHWAERKLMRIGTPPVGSRRRRAALRTSENVPFDQLPYQCFQEARKILQEDREEKLKAIAKKLAKIKQLEEKPAGQLPGTRRDTNMRIQSLKKYVEELKILIDINDPVVKRRFEDGLGDMNKPIYRHLAEKKWRGLPYRIITQRIEQLYIVPDVLPKFEPTVDVQLFFRRIKVDPGEILDSRISEVSPRLKVQVFDAGERLVSVVVVDLDVPDAENDAFNRRCHYLAVNVPLSPDQPSLPLGKVNKETQLALPWLPAFSQMGAPYHRMAVFVLEQKNGVTLDIEKLRDLYKGRDGFSLKSFRDKFELNPVGFNLFRTVWDEGTAGVMERAGVPGADIQFKHKRVYSLKGPRKARGWEAKRSKPKYKSLWKYSKNIHGMNRRR